MVLVEENGKGVGEEKRIYNIIMDKSEANHLSVIHTQNRLILRLTGAVANLSWIRRCRAETRLSGYLSQQRTCACFFTWRRHVCSIIIYGRAQMQCSETYHGFVVCVQAIFKPYLVPEDPHTAICGHNQARLSNHCRLPLAALLSLFCRRLLTCTTTL